MFNIFILPSCRQPAAQRGSVRLKVTRSFTTSPPIHLRRPGTAGFHLAVVTLTEERGTGAGPPRCLVTGTKWFLPSGVLTCEQAESQDASWLNWRTGRQMSSVSGPVVFKRHVLIINQNWSIYIWSFTAAESTVWLWRPFWTGHREPKFLSLNIITNLENHFSLGVTTWPIRKLN